MDWDFHVVEGVDVCRVQVQPSGHPVFEGGPGGGAFWWRYPTGTVRITDEDERDRIIARRWEQKAA